MGHGPRWCTLVSLLTKANATSGAPAVDSRSRHTRPETDHQGSAVVTLILAAGVQVGKYHGRAPVEDDETLLAPHHKAADAQC